MVLNCHKELADDNKTANKSVIEEGFELWKRQKEAAKQKKIKEQQEIREIFQNYWPWSQHLGKPRGLRNLRTDGLYPYGDYKKAARLVGCLDLGKPGGGAPRASPSGQKLVRTKEDPLLRYQWEKNLRRCVDNTLRYKKDVKDMEEYKKQLDEQILEKKIREQKEKLAELEYQKSLGWSTEKTLSKLGKEPDKPKTNPKKEHVTYENAETEIVEGKLPPIKKPKINGSELVNLMAKPRTYAMKIPLGTTDVTRDGIQWYKKDNTAYLEELCRQINSKAQQIKKLHDTDVVLTRNHFQTLDSFWGRPGNGAPQNGTKKRNLYCLLYPELYQIKV